MHTPAKHPSADLWYWEKSPHSTKPHVLPPDVFDALRGYLDHHDPIGNYSQGLVQRRFYSTEAAALAALNSPGR